MTHKGNHMQNFIKLMNHEENNIQTFIRQANQLSEIFISSGFITVINPKKMNISILFYDIDADTNEYYRQDKNAQVTLKWDEQCWDMDTLKFGTISHLEFLYDYNLIGKVISTCFQNYDRNMTRSPYCVFKPQECNDIGDSFDKCDIFKALVRKVFLKEITYIKEYLSIIPNCEVEFDDTEFCIINRGNKTLLTFPSMNYREFKVTISYIISEDVEKKKIIANNHESNILYNPKLIINYLFFHPNY
jgi:hypothetical protein